MKKLYFCLFSIIFFIFPLESNARDSIRNPTNPENVTGSVLNIECPNVERKLSVVCFEEDQVMPGSEIGKIVLNPSIEIDWKKYAPKEILSFDSSNPNEIVLGKLVQMSKYHSRYYFPIKLDNVSKNCFNYYLLDGTNIYNLKPVKLMGVVVIDYEYKMSPYFGYLIAELPRRVNIQHKGVGLGIISRDKIEAKVEINDVKNNPSLFKKIELISNKSISISLLKWINSDRLFDTYLIKIKGDDKKYLFLTGMEMLHDISTGEIYIENNSMEYIESKHCFWGEL